MDKRDRKKIAIDTEALTRNLKVKKSETLLEEDIIRLLNEQKDYILSGKGVNDTILSFKFTNSIDACLELNKLGYKNICCLNYASALNPGGGFLNGQDSQEESLARATSLYHSLLSQPHLYVLNRKKKPNDGLYITGMIYSPEVYIVKNNNGKSLQEHVPISVITMAACNRRVTVRRSEWDSQVDEIMKARCRYVLMVAAAKKQEVVVIGLWGCGLFRNDPNKIIPNFKKVLEDELKGFFKLVMFVNVSNEQ